MVIGCTPCPEVQGTCALLGIIDDIAMIFLFCSIPYSRKFHCGFPFEQANYVVHQYHTVNNGSKPNNQNKKH